jgi:hypothetical protein
MCRRGGATLAVKPPRQAQDLSSWVVLERYLEEYVKIDIVVYSEIHGKDHITRLVGSQPESSNKIGRALR